MLHVRQINSAMLLAAVENVVHRMQFLEFTNGAHIKPNFVSKKRLLEIKLMFAVLFVN